MVMLLSASAFGRDTPSPLSSRFPPSTLRSSTPPSPKRRAPLVAAHNGHQESSGSYGNTPLPAAPGSGPSTPGNAIDSDLESPHGTHRLVLPPRKDSMRYARPKFQDLAADSPNSSSTPESPATPPVVLNHSQDRSQDSPTIPKMFEPTPLRPSQRATVMPVHRALGSKLSLFPSPPKAHAGSPPSIPNFSGPRPILKQNRSHTESSLPTLKSSTSSSESPTGSHPRIGALQRAHTSPQLEASSTIASTTSTRPLVPVPASIPTITIKRPTPDVRRPSAVEIIAARPLSTHATTIHTGPGHAYEVHEISGPQFEGQSAVKWVKKEDKARRKLERAMTMRSRSSEPRITKEKPDQSTSQSGQKETAVRNDTKANRSHSSEPRTTKEKPGPSVKHSGHEETAVRNGVKTIRSHSSEPRTTKENPHHSVHHPIRQEATVWVHRDVPGYMDSPTLGTPAFRILTSPTINRPHPLRSLAQGTERSQSEIRVPSTPGPHAKHTRNASDSTVHDPFPPVLQQDQPRGRTRSRAASIATLDFSSRVPPAQGPLDIRKSTFRPFKPELDPEALAALEMLRSGGDMYALAAQKEKEMEKEKLRKVGVPRSKYQMVKPWAPPKLDTAQSGAGGQGAKTAAWKTNSPLAKLASLVK